MYIVLTRHHKDPFPNVYGIYKYPEAAKLKLESIRDEIVRKFNAEIIDVWRLDNAITIIYKRKGYKGKQYFYVNVLNTANYKIREQ